MKLGSQLVAGDRVLMEDGSLNTITKVQRGFVKMELKGVTKMARFVDYKDGSWEHVHPDEEIDVV